MKAALAFILAVCFLFASAIAQTPAPAAAPASPQAVAPSDIDGVWMGTLNVSAIKLRIAFHIKNTANGLVATMDSLDQSARGIPVSSVVRDGSSLKMEVKVAQGQFAGEISKDLQSITGTWSQGPNNLPLVLNRAKDADIVAETPHPQTPKRPLPYREEDVSYANPAAPGVTLAGTLTVPSGKGPFPAVLLITGSGAQDRDETLLGHKPFFVLSDYLTRKGIVVLRVDDRGFAKSTGSAATATTADFATDVEAGVAFLKSRPEVNGAKIGLIGHSEGAVIAPMVAARHPGVAYIVMMAGTAVPGDEVICEQIRLISEASGRPADAIAAAVAEEREVLAIVKATPDNAEAEKLLRARLAGKIPDGQMTAQIRSVLSPWYRYFLAYDPSPALRKLTVPVLALNGSKDTQVSAKQNLPLIRKDLEEAHDRDFEVAELAGLNHLFQTAKTGSPAEYGLIEETIAPAALDKIGTWILAHTR